MGNQTLKGLVIADFNADNLAALLTNDRREPPLLVKTAPYGQVYQMLMDADSEYWREGPDFAVVWTRPQGVIRSFKELMNFEQVPLEQVLEEVDAYADLLDQAKDRARFFFVPTWVVPAYQRSFGLLDMREGIGIANILMRMNLRLAERLEGAENIYLLNTQRWTETVGKHAHNPKMWYMGKIGFANEVFKEIAEDIRSALMALNGQGRKLIILDLDDTLWGGIVGDDGWENLILGGHSPVGEAFVDFQHTLKSLTKRGIVLGVVSKNEEEVALEAIRNHPEMVLGESDFVGWKINWNDKAQNIVELVQELSLGLQSVVFIDDNPVERARVREMLPEVLVPEWPEDKILSKKALLSLTCFNTPTISREDAQRTQMYVKERQRRDLRAQVSSPEAWLSSLDIQVQVELLNETNLPRAAQLFNKTNQMNLSTRRLTEVELMDWAQQTDHRLWTLRVADKYGDSGLTGIISLAIAGNTGQIVDFLLSCRVMGRKIEETMLAIAVQAARDLGLEMVVAEYQPTKKNKPCLEFWQRSGFSLEEGGSRFCWSTQELYPFPEQVHLERVLP